MSESERTGPWVCNILTLFPEFFFSPLGTSILGRARAAGLIKVEPWDIRAFAQGRHQITDDTPYGGGAGMVMKAEPILRAFEAAEEASLSSGGARPRRVVMTPGGRTMNHDQAQRFARLPALSLLCGRYEGIDERVMPHVDEQISLGDFVLTGGEPAALAIIDAAARFVPGVLGNKSSAEDESFGQGLLEYPQYTRPPVLRGAAVPSVLRSGDHGRIAKWRRAQALLRTRDRRPDLYAALTLTKQDRRLLKDASFLEDHQGYPKQETPNQEGSS